MPLARTCLVALQHGTLTPPSPHGPGVHREPGEPQRVPSCLGTAWHWVLARQGTVPPTRATQFATRMAMPAPCQPQGRLCHPQQGHLTPEGGDQRVPSPRGGMLAMGGAGWGPAGRAQRGEAKDGGSEVGAKGSAHSCRSITPGGSTRMQSLGTYQTGAVWCSLQKER